MESLLAQLKSKNILYAEDESGILNHTSEMLRFFFNKVISAQDGKEALELYQEHKKELDLILLDVKMPYFNGLEVTQQIRKQDKTLPVVLMSAYSDKNFLFEAIKLNLEDYILKPFDLNKFLEVMSGISQHCWKEENVFYLFSNNTRYDFNNRVLLKNNMELSLGKKEEKLIRLLLQTPFTVVTKEMIDEKLYEFDMTENKYRSLLKNLRAKIGHDSIETVSGIGIKIRYKDVVYK